MCVYVYIYICIHISQTHTECDGVYLIDKASSADIVKHIYC